jgi:hypothetical protein
MPPHHKLRRSATATLIATVVTPAVLISASRSTFDVDRTALVAALEALIATGQPRHNTHDEGERLQLAVDDAIARGDQEVERLAVRAASPLTATISRPVSSTRDLPSIQFESGDVLRVPRPAAYTADIKVSFDNGPFVPAAAIRSGLGASARVDAATGKAAFAPGFHVVRVKAELTFGATGHAPQWTEARALSPLFYAVFDPMDESTAPIRALMYGPAATTARELDPTLGDEPFAVWLAGVLSARRLKTDGPPEWTSEYCDERTGEAGHRPPPTAICAVAYLQLAGHIGQIWFRTADIVDTETSPTWKPLSPSEVEGFVLDGVAQEGRLSALPRLLDTDPANRPVGDVSIIPSDIVVSPADPAPGAFTDATITVRNIGSGDLWKVVVYVSFGVDPKGASSRRQFVVDLGSHQSTDLKLQVAFPAGYGFIMAQALQLGEHAPSGNWTPDPTPFNECAIRIIGARIMPASYVQQLAGASGGCDVAK